jgi:ABC-type glycerol-3-phosphate transport system permease component
MLKERIFLWPPALQPETGTLENCSRPLESRDAYIQAGAASGTAVPPSAFFPLWFLNSVIVTIGTMFSTVVSTLAAYSLTCFRFPGQRSVTYLALLSCMMPSIIFVFPMFLAMVEICLTDTLLSLFLGYVCITLPFCMWMMWAFFRCVPIQIEEAALVDLASQSRVFRVIVLPTAWSGIIPEAPSL